MFGPTRLIPVYNMVRDYRGIQSQTLLAQIHQDITPLIVIKDLSVFSPLTGTGKGHHASRNAVDAGHLFHVYADNLRELRLSDL